MTPGETQRLHPLTILAGLPQVGRSLGGAAAAGAIFVAQGRYTFALLFAGAIVAASLVRPLIRYLSFSWIVTDDQIDMWSGVLNRNHRSIPFDRVQDVNLEQNVLHRALKLARVKLETGGSAGGKTEDGVLDSISMDAAGALRDLIRAHRHGTAAVAAEAGPDATVTEAPPIFAMDGNRVLLAGIYSFSLAILGVLVGLAQTVGDAVGINPFSRNFWQMAAAESGPYLQLVLANRFLSAIAGLLSLVVVGLATGVLQTLLREWGFRLDRTESGFRRRRGLLTLTDVVLPIKRVQAAIIATGPFRRRRGWEALRLQSLARDTVGGDHVIAPLAHRSETEAILASMDWRPLPSGNGWRRPSAAYVIIFLVILIPFAMAAMVAILLGMWWGALGLAAIGMVGFARLFAWRRHRHVIDGDRLLIHSGWWRDKTVILPLKNIQSADISRNFIDRRFGVSHLRLGVAGGRGFSAHAVDAIPHDWAVELRARLLQDFI